MTDLRASEKGWKPIPKSLKILSCVFVFWAVMTLPNIKFALNVGYPLVGVIFNGALGVVIALLLNVLAPLIFVYALWNRYHWGLAFAMTYIAFFIVNNTIALIWLQKQIGLPEILFPLLANVVFLGVIYRTKKYFLGNVKN